jgi:hypothetical protein
LKKVGVQAVADVDLFPLLAANQIADGTSLLAVKNPKTPLVRGDLHGAAT